VVIGEVLEDVTVPDIDRLAAADAARYVAGKAEQLGKLDRA
jgi:hypothetical protein